MSSAPIVNVQVRSYDNDEHNAQAENRTSLTGPDSECPANDDEGLGLNIGNADIRSSPRSIQSQRFTSNPYHDINNTRQSPLNIGPELPETSFAPYGRVEHIYDRDISDAERQEMRTLFGPFENYNSPPVSPYISYSYFPDSPSPLDSHSPLDSQFTSSSPSLCDAIQQPLQQLQLDLSDLLPVPAPPRQQLSNPPAPRQSPDIRTDYQCQPGHGFLITPTPYLFNPTESMYPRSRRFDDGRGRTISRSSSRNSRGGGGASIYSRRSSPYPVSSISTSSASASVSEFEQGSSDQGVTAVVGGSELENVVKPEVASRAIIDASQSRRLNPARWLCKVCGSSFTRRNNLKGHETAHKGEKPFECTVDGCGQAFARQTDLRRHEKNVHKLENRKKDTNLADR